MEKNPDYKNTVIYKIIPKDTNLNYCYVGSTVCLQIRTNHHKSVCNNTNSNRHNLLLYKTIRENGGWENWEVIKIIDYPCETEIEAKQKEQEYIKELSANLNMLRAFRTEEEKQEQIKKDNRTKEQINEKSKKYYHNNKEICNEKSKDYYNNNKEYFEQKRKEYYELHKEELAEKKKIYREQNKDKIRQKEFEQVICICGSSYIKKGESRHFRTAKHINFIENLTDK